MSKELTPLENFEYFIRCFAIDSNEELDTIKKLYAGTIKVIESALKDYEKKTKLAKEYADVNNVAKRLKSFEIIKEKEVNVYYFKNACATMSYKQYFSMWNADCFVGIQMTSKTMLAQEEFDFLKEILK